MTDQRQPCQRPNCEGAYEDVGGGQLYCDICGVSPVISPAGLVSSPPTGVTNQSGSRSAASLSGTTSNRSVSVRSSRKSTSSSSGRNRLGAGLVTVPEVPRPDPALAVLANPEVPERKRFCSNSDCGSAVGRSRGDHPGRTEGFCTKCGRRYSFVPKLNPGDVVRGQYKVAGCLAHGGLGWIYLAVDHAVSNRWVVLKGLLDTGDEDAMAAAISERRFLAEIEHSNIVRIYNFVEHLDQRTGSLDGYIVMEYVGGKSLKEIANERRTPEGRRDPLPVEQACAYGIEALDALGHLHSRNLLYCDFKVDNAIQQNDQLKLIDMGAVRRMGDEDSAIYGTVGYQAPEVAELGPSVASDLYTVARTLAVLTFDFQGYTNVFVDSLPDPENIEVFQRYESFYRLLVRATDPDPQRRFASAEEMSEQLTGVLREVVALQSGRPRPSLSTLFGAEQKVADTELLAQATGDTSVLGARVVKPSRRARKRPAASVGDGTAQAHAQAHAHAHAHALPGGATTSSLYPTAGATYGQTPAHVRLPSQLTGRGQPDTAPETASGTVPGQVAMVPLETRATALALPVPRVDPGDPNAGFLAGLQASDPADLIAALRAAPTDSAELRLRELRARLEMPGAQAGALATEALAELEAKHADDWRVIWYRGVSALVNGDRETAALSFDAVYDAFPGEPAPKLALGVCAEVLGQLDNAAEYYRLVWATDPNYVSAAFGLARVRLAAGDRMGAVAALESVPEASIHYIAARIAAVRARLRQREPQGRLLDDLYAAADQVERLQEMGLDALRRERLCTEVLGSALDWVLAGRQGAPPGPEAGQLRPLLGSALSEEGLRLGLERAYRRLARLAQTGTERIEWVERANRFRPRTWV
ncbi:serine/threonine-protein kinase [Streptomyces gobiensis]|uniref:serine/threonine-protein kinase n=1 Tax=Streptomyces gobiensis TaxID=2875706 RepID=UPI001E31FB94|nr:serine/threonine-protein kinase [Streptomyces gobiensis]UGY91448.1 serine/threonine-protein kinase PknG [Streptomyces gobiensis]